jgi:hypothetical protein
MSHVQADHAYSYPIGASLGADPVNASQITDLALWEIADKFRASIPDRGLFWVLGR